MNENINSPAAVEKRKWLHPNELLKQQRLKLKQKQLQARINKKSAGPSERSPSPTASDGQPLSDLLTNSNKRYNPFVIDKPAKCPKLDNASARGPLRILDNFSTTFGDNRVLAGLLTNGNEPQTICKETQWIPIDWALKSRLRMLSTKPFAWNNKLKVSEEASGITGFVRCLDNNSLTTLDTSPNSKFHQSCLYWQQPSLPWLNLFPRTTGRTATGNNIGSIAVIRESLHQAWSDSLRSLFQLVRTRQCPYFYICSNNFTVLFRAAGICSSSETMALVTPTTRGFRLLLQQEDIVFKMPLKSATTMQKIADTGMVDDEELDNERWLQTMGINAEDIKSINSTQAKLVYNAECDIDNSDESLIIIEGMEVNGFYNFLMNCKSITSLTGPTPGIPPTLLAPVAFQGATLSSLKVRESKVRNNDRDYFSLELNGPILPHLIHNLSLNHPSDQDYTATFANIDNTLAFSKVNLEQIEKKDDNACGIKIFGQENLSDCGLNIHLLKHFCSANRATVCNVECLKYNAETKTYTWS